MSLFSKLSKNNDKTLYPWSQKKLGGSNSALPRAGHAATAVSADAFIIYGGTHRTSTKKELFYIDANNLSANSVNTSGELPSPRTSPVIVAMNGHVLLFGGKPLAHDESYDPAFYLLNLHSKQWTRMQMEGVRPTERFGHSAVAHEGIMYIWGGQNEGTYFNDLFIFNSSTFSTTPRWEQLGYNNECPEARSGHISQFFENKLFIFGGTDGQRLFDDIWCFDLHTGLWTRIEPDGFYPAARESCASAMVDDVIYIIGGKGENGVELNDLCAYKIRHRRWFRFQNMGPSPSPRHGLTMTAVRDKLYVLGGDNETARLDDSSFIFILDSTKIKYPADIPPPQQVSQQVPQQQQQQQQQIPQQQQQIPQQQQQIPQHQQQPAEPPVHQPQYDTSSIEEMNGQPQQYYQQQQYQQQMQGGQVPQQQYQQSIQQKPFPDQRQQPQPGPSQSTPTPQRTGSSKSGNSLQKEIDTSVNYIENNVQPSPTSSSNSPSSLTSRHRSYYPEAQSQSSVQPPARPPRHMSTVPEAALRRPRATSPLPQPESDIAADIRRQYQTPASPNMENSALMYGSPIHGGSLLGSPMAASILSATEEDFVEPQRMMSPAHPTASRSSPVAPPPRPPREGVGLGGGNAQRNPAVAANLNRELDEQLRPKSHMVVRNPQHSPQPLLPTENSPQLQQQQLVQEQAQQQQLLAQQQQQQLLAQQQQQQHQLAYEQQLAHEQAQLLAQQQQYQDHVTERSHVPERSPSRQVHSSPSPVNRPKPDHTAATTAAAVSAATAAATAAATTAAAEERHSLVREIKERDVVISEMKKKENWWRTEVSLARKQRTIKGESFDDGPDADEALLMDIDHLEDDKVKLFEQLISVKSELRRVRASILQQAQPMSEKVAQADRMRTAALQEAAYFKSKYLALKSHRQDDLKHIEVSRCDDLEKRLATALIENESNSKMLQQLQKRSQHDQTARVATEERAKEAQERAEEAQQAHQRALEELQVVYNRATKAELQVRDNAVKIADLTHQLSEALMEQPIIKSQEVTEAQLKASQLEAANLKARNDIASLKQKLAESMDDIARLRTILNEREDSLSDAKIHVEDCEIQLGMMREALNQQHQKTSVNGFAPTRAY